MIGFDPDDAHTAFSIEGSNTTYVASYGNNTDTTYIQMYTNSQSNTGYMFGTSNILDIPSFVFGSIDPTSCNVTSADMVIYNHNIGYGGNSNPAFTVDILGDLNFTGNLYKSSNLVSFDAWMETTNGPGIFNDSKVGIGTNAPARLLHVHTGAAGILPTYGESAVFNGAISVMHGVNDGYRFMSALDNSMTTNSTRSIVFGKTIGLHNQAELTFTNVNAGSPCNYLGLGLYGGVYASVTGEGNVGIGTTAPRSRLTVNNGGATIGSGLSNAVAPDNTLLVHGSIGIGTDTPQASIHTTAHAIVGSLTSYGQVISFSDMSDVSLKENFVGIGGALAKLNNIIPVEFDWRADIFNKDMAGTHDVGLVAQNVEQVCPLVVGSLTIPGENASTTYKTVKYEKMVPYLIQAIKEMSTTITDLQTRLATLESA